MPKLLGAAMRRAGFPSTDPSEKGLGSEFQLRTQAYGASRRG